MNECVSFQTSDGVRLAAHWYPVEQPRGWALLLHMMPATKESYATLANELQEQDIACLAFDQRGHGESDGGPQGYESFSDEQQQEKWLDVCAALGWLAVQGMKEECLVVIGASIGANLALRLLVEHQHLPAAVLLSPGRNYRGIETLPLAQRVRSAQRVLLAAGGADDAHSTETVYALKTVLDGRADTRVFEHAGHGTAMLERVDGFIEEVVQWVLKQ
ncbi:MAG: alpha/beta fold hydrolase [Candidatus Uhrbacteria bacterium]